MNGCTLTSFDLGQCITGTLFGWLAPFWSAVVFWFWIALAIVVLLVVLAIFARLRQAFGWYGVIAGLFVFTNAITAALAFAYRGKIDAARIVAHPVTGKPQAMLPGAKGPTPIKKSSALRPVVRSRTIFDDIQSLTNP